VGHCFIAIFLIMVLGCAAAALSVWAEPPPSCAPSSDPICRIVGSVEFAAAYRDAAADAVDPADAVDDVRANLRRAMVGAGQAGPAAIDRQVDGVLDDALDRAQRRMCAAGATPVAAIVAGLSAAAEERGARLGSATLGAMTGTLIAAARARGSTCLCLARGFEAIVQACASR
jgi:hypothetical protein